MAAGSGWTVTSQPLRSGLQPVSPVEKPAGLLRRIGAMVYDALIILAVWMFTLFPVVALRNDVVVGPGIQSLLFIELFGFFAYFWLMKGQTIGMLAWHLKLETLDGGPLRPRAAILRFLGALLSFATCGVGYLWIYIDPAHRSWSDLFSGTITVHARPEHAR